MIIVVLSVNAVLKESVAMLSGLCLLTRGNVCWYLNSLFHLPPLWDKYSLISNYHNIVNHVVQPRSSKLTVRCWFCFLETRQCALSGKLNLGMKHIMTHEFALSMRPNASLTGSEKMWIGLLLRLTRWISMVAHKCVLFSSGVVTLDFNVVKLFQNLATWYNAHTALLLLSYEQ